MDEAQELRDLAARMTAVGPRMLQIATLVDEVRVHLSGLSGRGSQLLHTSATLTGSTQLMQNCRMLIYTPR
jgi:hypothetical protein